MKLRVLILSLVLFISFQGISPAQQNTLDDGFHTFLYPNGNISSEGMIRDGKPDGYWKSYYVTGVLKSEGKRRNFMLDSLWVFYTQTGDTLEKIDYLFGKKSGYYLKYKRDNIHGLYIYSRELYAADKREGVAYIYYPDGKIKQTLPYSEGRKQGLSREYDDDGQLITLYEYNNDFLIARERINRYNNEMQKHGDWKEFYPGGSIHREMTYRNGLLHGNFRGYDEKGSLLIAIQ